MKSLPTRRLVLALIGFMLFALGLAMVQSAENGLAVLRFQVDGSPISVYTSASARPVERPLVLVAHGYAGSETLMRGFSLTLAHAGYTVAAWDFDGHAANARRLGDRPLLVSVEQVVNALAARRLTERGRIAILGHSMGSGVALEYGVEHPFTQAVIAISPVMKPVRPALPQNLLLMAGSLEPRFLLNAQQLQAQAGGPGPATPDGRGREMVVIPNVEHISILFSNAAQQQALAWLDQTFGPQAGRRPYRDQRIRWYIVALVGAVLCAANLTPAPAVQGESSLPVNRAAAPAAPTRPGAAGLQAPAAPRLESPAQAAPTSQSLAARSVDLRRAQAHPPAPLWRLALGLVGGAALATGGMWLLGRLGVDLRSLLGVAVGGYLLTWFGAAGVLAGLVGGVRWNRPRQREIRGALVVFLALWLGFGWLGGRVWLHWELTAQRLIWWPVGVLLMLPWLLTVGSCLARSGWVGRLAWWLAQSVLLSLSFIMALRLNPELGFLLLILPLLPVVLLIHTLAAAGQASRWAFAISGAALLSWLILAVFPLI